VGAHASAGAHVGTYLHVVVRRSTFNVQPSTFNLQRSTFNPSRPSPRPSSPRPSPQTFEVGRSHPAWAHMPVRAHMSVPTYTLSSDVQRATCNLQPLSPLASRRSPHPPSPRPSPQTFEVGRSHPAWAHMPVRAHMSVPTYTLSSDVQRATCNLQPRAPLASPLAPNL
jgi:hypothetical protein